MRPAIRDRFERTECSCEACATGCRTMPGTLALGDLERIAEATGGDAQSPDWLGQHFEASGGGCKIARINKQAGTIELIEIDTIVPALIEENGSERCVFLTPEGKCGIHEVSPFGCAYLDSHQDAEEADERVRALTAELEAHIRQSRPFQSGGPLTYHERWQVLRSMGKTPRRPTIERRMAFERAHAEAETKNRNERPGNS